MWVQLPVKETVVAAPDKSSNAASIAKEIMIFANRIYVMKAHFLYFELGSIASYILAHALKNVFVIVCWLIQNRTKINCCVTEALFAINRIGKCHPLLKSIGTAPTLQALLIRCHQLLC